MNTSASVGGAKLGTTEEEEVDEEVVEEEVGEEAVVVVAKASAGSDDDAGIGEAAGTIASTEVVEAAGETILSGCC